MSTIPPAVKAKKNFNSPPQKDNKKPPSNSKSNDNAKINVYTIRNASGTVLDIRNFNTYRTHNNSQMCVSYLMSRNDFCFSDSLDYDLKYVNFKPAIQPIILNEFQPDAQIYWTSLITTALNNLTIGITNASKHSGSKSTGNKIFNAVTKALRSAVYCGDAVGKGGAATQNKLVEYYSKNPGELWKSPEKLDNSTNIFEFMSHSPINYVYNMFNSGIWLNTYELPFFNNTYLESKEYAKWTNNRYFGSYW